MIDLILIDRRWQTSVELCRTFRGADMSCDYNLVLCNLKLKHITIKKYEKKRNIQALDDVTIRDKYQAETAKRIRDAEMEKLNMEGKATKLCEIIQQAVEATIPLAEQPKRKWISKQTLKLATEKRKMRLRQRY